MRIIGWASVGFGTLWGCLNGAAWTVLGGPGGEVENRMFLIDVYSVALYLLAGWLILIVTPRGNR